MLRKEEKRKEIYMAVRTIIFRGKRIDNGEWVYGDLQHDYNGEPRCISDYCGANPVDPPQ